MMIRTILIAATLIGVGSTALAASQGTPEQQAACRPDVRRFCHKLKETDGDDAFLQCLELNRDSLSKPCRSMLESYGK